MKLRDEITSIIMQMGIVQDNANCRINGDSELKEYGLDSVSFVQLIVTLESYYNVEFPDEKLSIEVAGTINKLTTIVDEILTNR